MNNITTIKFSRSSLIQKHVVYYHAVDEMIIFVGVCPLIELFRFPDASVNSMWYKLVEGDKEIVQSVLHVGDDLEDAQNFRYRWFKDNFMPICNAQGHETYKRKPHIKCIETGVVYPSQLAVARALDCSQSLVSNHLNNKKSYKRLKGNHYEYSFEKVT